MIGVVSQASVYIYFAAAVIAALALIVPALRSRPGPERLSKLAHDFARKADLALPPHLVLPIGERMARRHQVRLLTAGIGLVLVFVMAAIVSGTDLVPSGVRDLVVVALLPLGFAARLLDDLIVDDLIVALWDRGLRPPGRGRAVHLPAPGLADFVAPVERWIARTLTACSVAVAVWVLAVRPGIGSGLILGLTLLVLLGAELGARTIVAGRPVASDVQSLAFDDALRAEAVRNLLLLASSIPAVLFLNVWAGLDLPDLVMYILVGLVGGGLLIAELDGRGRRRSVRERLWGPAPTTQV
jgi:hypothetical protein